MAWVVEIIMENRNPSIYKFNKWLPTQRAHTSTKNVLKARFQDVQTLT